MDVAHQHPRNLGRRREAHIGEVAVAQIDFAGAARALDNHQIGLRRHPPETVEDGRHELPAVVEIIAGGHRRLPPALDDDLGAGGGFGLQQHRVHVDGRCYLRGARL